jgi:hypothetical protein
LPQQAAAAMAAAVAAPTPAEQSLQSKPMLTRAYSDPGPPSSHSPLLLQSLGSLTVRQFAESNRLHDALSP